MIELNLPVKAKGYIILNQLYGNKVELSKKDHILSYIYNSLLFGKKANSIELPSCYYKNYTLLLKKYMVLDLTIKYIPTAVVPDINELLTSVFDKTFFTKVIELHYSKKLQIKKAIEIMMEAWDIDEDEISFDSLKKSFWRYRQKELSMFKKIHSKVPKYEHDKDLLTEHIHILVSEEDKKLLISKAKSQKTSMGNMIRYAIRNHTLNLAECTA